jgi:transcriptional regulator with XRE-family HTH domain
MHGSILRTCRERLGLQQNQFAERVGVHPDYVSKLERSERTPSFPVALKMWEVLERPSALHPSIWSPDYGDLMAAAQETAVSQ